ncbi:hypothetical protein SAMN05444349_13152 [Bacteroides faecichinchillae]|uniref:Uncharacterized protein n=1 Tax=Bacteroides faecichinchillae TaxID=871325 RepID=A0A1M5DZL7_9BACE|nr:hypothetical protein SAMN05444349_13152 [Bacteroides faecichinchillae]
MQICISYFFIPLVTAIVFLIISFIDCHVNDDEKLSLFNLGSG